MKRSDSLSRPAIHGTILAIFVLSMGLFGCGEKESARLAPRDVDTLDAPISVTQLPGTLSDADLARIESTYAAAPTPAPLVAASTTPVAEPTKPREKDIACDAWSQKIRERFMYITFRKVGDDVGGVLYDRETDTRINVIPGTEENGLRVDALDNDAITLSARNCTIRLARSTEEPVPVAAAPLDQATVLKCAATVQLFKQIASTMDAFYQKNGYFPFPGRQDGSTGAQGDPQVPNSGYVPSVLVEPGVYLNTMPNDPFEGRGDTPFRYGVIPDRCWVVVGNGPDGDADIDPMLFLNSWDEGGFQRFKTKLSGNVELYDPARGGNSNGDIVVWGPGGEPTLSDSQFIAASGGLARPPEVKE